MNNYEFVFLAGLHRSGTSILHEILRDHPDISGLSDTGVPKDEGQHLQSIYQPAYVFGGPGRFIFDKRAYMDESHPLATEKNAKTIFEEWKNYYDLSSKYLIEKSPPNIIRTRFLQKLYPNSKFIVILRHPLAVAFATKKWSRTSSILSLLDHSLLATEIFLKDMKQLKSVYVLRYEEFVADPQELVNSIYEFLGLEAIKISREVHCNINEKYFLMWGKDRNNWINRIIKRVPKEIPNEFEIRANKCGYSFMNNPRLIPVEWLGANYQTKK